MVKTYERSQLRTAPQLKAIPVDANTIPIPCSPTLCDLSSRASVGSKYAQKKKPRNLARIARHDLVSSNISVNVTWLFLRLK